MEFSLHLISQQFKYSPMIIFLGKLIQSIHSVLIVLVLQTERIVISQWPHSPDRFSSSGIWYDLKDLRPIELTIPETLITYLVFSPDIRYIAAAGINQKTGKRKLYLIDTETGDKNFLPQIKDVWSLAWTPDGRQLASLNWPSFRMDTQSTLRIYVYDLDKGKGSSFVNGPNFPWGMGSVKSLSKVGLQNSILR